MARVELIMPKMGESVSEATIISWTKEVGENVELDETIVEIATDKVDSEVPSTHEGKLIEKLFKADDLVQVGDVFAILEVDGDDTAKETTTQEPKSEEKPEINEEKPEIKEEKPAEKTKANIKNEGNRFYSPLVRSMASKENIGIEELDNIPGTGKDGRVSKSDMVKYLENKGETTKPSVVEKEAAKIQPSTPIANTEGTEIIEKHIKTRETHTIF